MTEILPFRSKTERKEAGQHLRGSAICLTCRHDWEAVAPVGTTCLECPECGTQRGSWLYPVLPAVGDVRWLCSCGSELFSLIMPGRAMCAGCGKDVKGFP